MPTRWSPAELSVGLSDVMELAVFPDLAISLESLGARGTERWWFGLRPDRGVQVAVLPDGSRECVEIDPGCVIGQILAVTGTGCRADVAAPAGPDPADVSMADLTGGTSRVGTIVRVNTAWRVGTMIRGGVFAWARGVDGSQWLAEPKMHEEGSRWTLSSIELDRLRAELLDHLPGAESRCRSTPC